MPAIPVLLQWLIVAFFGSDVLKKYGLNPADVEKGASGTGAAQAAPPATPGAVPAPTTSPTVKQITSDAVKNPTSLFGIAAVGFVSVFVIAQIRAGTHEAVETSKDLYSAGSSATRSLSNADGSTRNISRRAKG